MAEFFIDKLCFPVEDAIKMKAPYERMFPVRGCFTEVPTVRGCLWTVKISLQALARYVDIHSMIDAVTIAKIYAYVEKNQVVITPDTIAEWLKLKAPKGCTEYTKFSTAIKKVTNHSVLVNYYTSRRTEFISFLARAVKHESAVEVALNL